LTQNVIIHRRDPQKALRCQKPRTPIWAIIC